jgi:hypothetical protein
MKNPSRAKLAVTPSQVAAFRLARHHLISPAGNDPVEVCRDVCGVQAQLRSAARMAIGARTRGLAPARIEAALWQQRTLVKTLCMRQTLHLLPSAEYPVYMVAVRKSRVAAIVRIMARFNITTRDTDALDRATMTALEEGPLTLRELVARVRPRVSSRVRAWMDRVSNPMRLAIVEGLICYGPDQGQQVTFVRVDQWLPRRRQITEEEAQHSLLLKFLRAYGPATLRDFSHWSGVPVNQARDTWAASADQMGPVLIEGREAWALREDTKTLAQSKLTRPVVRLLPAFDPFLLAHAEKDHLVEPPLYKRIFRNLGWISPVVLLNGVAVGTWSHVCRGTSLTIAVQPFAKLSRRICEGIEEEAASLGRFLDAKPIVQLARP